MEKLGLFDKFVSYLTPGHLEGIVLYVISTAILTGVHIWFRKDIIVGLKGHNGLMDGPEVLLYFCLWIFPSMVFADQFLQLKASDIVWYALIGFVACGLFGRWGLEWILAFKSGASQVTSSTTEKIVEKEKVITEQK